MPIFTIRDAKVSDCGKMARMLRPAHEASFVSFGVSSHREIRTTFAASFYKKAFLIDGKLAGLGGAFGPLLSPFAFVWVCLSDRATRYPVQIVREARKQLAEIMKTREELSTIVMLNDEAALRLATFLGFHVCDHGMGAPAESRAGRRMLREYIMSTPELHVNAGKASFIRMGYHPVYGDDLPGLAN